MRQPFLVCVWIGCGCRIKTTGLVCVCVFFCRSFASVRLPAPIFITLSGLYSPRLSFAPNISHSFSFARFQCDPIVFVHPDFPGTPFILNEMLALLKPIINNNQSHPFVASLWLVWLACAQIYNMNGNYTRLSVERIRCSVYTQTVVLAVNSKMRK